MKTKTIVTIIPSIALQEARLEALAGRKGEIIEVCRKKDGSPRGAWVMLHGGAYLGEREWYIPASSFSPV